MVEKWSIFNFSKSALSGFPVKTYEKLVGIGFPSIMAKKKKYIFFIFVEKKCPKNHRSLPVLFLGICKKGHFLRISTGRDLCFFGCPKFVAYF